MVDIEFVIGMQYVVSNTIQEFNLKAPAHWHKTQSYRIAFSHHKPIAIGLSILPHTSLQIAALEYHQRCKQQRWLATVRTKIRYASERLKEKIGRQKSHPKKE